MDNPNLYHRNGKKIDVGLMDLIIKPYHHTFLTYVKSPSDSPIALRNPVLKDVSELYDPRTGDHYFLDLKSKKALVLNDGTELATDRLFNELIEEGITPPTDTSMIFRTDTEDISQVLESLRSKGFKFEKVDFDSVFNKIMEKVRPRKQDS
ncbi:hypothetical protein KY308_03160 [Candidatus Woesearchaeota archaeon]|nr:hypothetical protein [Candidatus Woesearchaeota archaeon]